MGHLTTDELTTRMDAVQGEDEGLQADKRLYEAMIKSFCRRGDLSSGLLRLQEMQSRGMQPGKDHISALVTAHALAGNAYGECIAILCPVGESCLSPEDAPESFGS